MTPAGIEPATFRFVAQNLNHCEKYKTYKGKEKNGLRAERTITGKFTGFDFGCELLISDTNVSVTPNVNDECNNIL